MAYSLKDTIWSLFGEWENKQDSFKVNGKGIAQRFNEMLGEDFDENTLPFIDKISEKTMHPDLMHDSFVGYWETVYGIPIIIDDMTIRRRILRYGARINRIRGTALSFELVFNLIGIACEVDTFFDEGGFDKGLKFDNPNRKFDSSEFEQFSVPFYLTLSGAPIDGPELERIINVIVKWLSPMDSHLSGYAYDSGNESNQFDYDFDFNLG